MISSKSSPPFSDSSLNCSSKRSSGFTSTRKSMLNPLKSSLVRASASLFCNRGSQSNPSLCNAMSRPVASALCAEGTSSSKGGTPSASSRDCLCRPTSWRYRTGGKALMDARVPSNSNDAIAIALYGSPASNTHGVLFRSSFTENHRHCPSLQHQPPRTTVSPSAFASDLKMWSPSAHPHASTATPVPLDSSGTSVYIRATTKRRGRLPAKPCMFSADRKPACSFPQGRSAPC